MNDEEAQWFRTRVAQCLPHGPTPDQQRHVDNYVRWRTIPTVLPSARAFDGHPTAYESMIALLCACDPRATPPRHFGNAGIQWSFERERARYKALLDPWEQRPPGN